MEGLTPKEKIWYDRFDRYCKETQTRYAISWHMRIEYGIPTGSINYHLSKLVEKGILKSVKSQACVHYYYAEDFE